ncbi:hypothetical protein LTR85_010658 [Meristemomyces frigidus]|nr:hypothetical protein LTR85_010658 [Meristemomyces frigidus]
MDQAHITPKEYDALLSHGLYFLSLSPNELDEEFSAWAPTRAHNEGGNFPKDDWYMFWCTTVLPYPARNCLRTTESHNGPELGELLRDHIDGLPGWQAKFVAELHTYESGAENGDVAPRRQHHQAEGDRSQIANDARRFFLVTKSSLLTAATSELAISDQIAADLAEGADEVNAMEVDNGDGVLAEHPALTFKPSSQVVWDSVACKKPKSQHLPQEIHDIIAEYYFDGFINLSSLTTPDSPGWRLPTRPPLLEVSLTDYKAGAGLYLATTFEEDFTLSRRYPKKNWMEYGLRYCRISSTRAGSKLHFTIRLEDFTNVNLWCLSRWVAVCAERYLNRGCKIIATFEYTPTPSDMSLFPRDGTDVQLEVVTLFQELQKFGEELLAKPAADTQRIGAKRIEAETWAWLDGMADDHPAIKGRKALENSWSDADTLVMLGNGWSLEEVRDARRGSAGWVRRAR